MGRPNCAADRSAHSRRSAFRDKEWVGAIVREEQSSLDQSLNCAICYICFNQTCECAYLTRDVRLRRDSNVTYAHSQDRKSTRLNSSHSQISYAVFCLKKKKTDPVLPPYGVLYGLSSVVFSLLYRLLDWREPIVFLLPLSHGLSGMRLFLARRPSPARL